MKSLYLKLLTVGSAFIAISACQSLPEAPAQASKSESPTVVEQPVAPVDPRAQKETMLNEALSVYAEGQYEEALTQLASLVEAPELPLTSQIKARKFMAFSHCALGRTRPCRQQFDLALEQDPTFQLTEAEKGHPVWGREFNAARAAALRNKRAPRKAS